MSEKKALPLSQSQLMDVTFRLTPNLRFYEQVHRGERCIVIQNPLTNKQFTTTPFVKAVLMHFTSPSRLGDVLKQVVNREEYSAQHWVDLFTQLLQAQIVSSPNLGNDFSQYDLAKKQHAKNQKLVLLKPWLLKLPLFNPNWVLEKLHSHSQYIWNRWFIFVWLMIVGAAAIGAIDKADDIVDFWQSRFLDPSNLWIALVVYILLKAAHELAHGVAAKQGGADVVETGIVLIFFVPLPYIDVSQSTLFQDKLSRITVAAAGMVVELLIAALAFFLWLWSDNIIVRDVCINIMLIGAISSLLFNANPLLKFDGYYILSDWLEIQNLSGRSVLTVRQFLCNKLFGLSRSPVAHTQGEFRWLLFYGLFAFLYRVGISLLILLYIGAAYLWVGILLAGWVMMSQLVMPLIHFCITAWKDAKRQQKRMRTGSVSLFIILSLTLFFFVLPMKQSIVVEGVVGPSADALITAQANGFVRSIQIKDGQQVSVGQTLFVLENEGIDADILFLRARLDELNVRVYQYATQDPSQADYYRNQVSHILNELTDVLEQKNELTVKAQVSGRFYSSQLQKKLGRYVNKGDRLGVIMYASAEQVTAVLNESQVAEIDGAQGVQVRALSGYIQTVAIESIVKTPASLDRLPSKYLGSLFGGDFPVGSQDESGLTPLTPAFQIEFPLHKPHLVPYLGGRVSVKFILSTQPLGIRGFNRFIQLLQERGILSKIL